MVRLIQVLSEAKGSNHGGVCRFDFPKTSDNNNEFYVKHCSRMNHKGDSSFAYQHQPVYEAVTCEMARILGLETPNFYVLMNDQDNLGFVSFGGQKMDIKPHQPFYFASEMLVHPKNESISEAAKILEQEEFYLNMLMISDVVGKKNNYIHDPHSDRVIYVDLGCNIVDAHENIMAFKTRHKSPLKKKDRRNAVKKFSRYEIVTKKGEGGKIGLMDFLESPRDMKLLSLNPRGNVRLDSLIPKIEIDEIVERLIAGLYLGKGLSKNGDNIYLNRIK